MIRRAFSLAFVLGTFAMPLQSASADEAIQQVIT
jgi:hypothetical protein